MDPVGADSTSNRHLTFQAGGALLAVPTSKVAEIAAVKEITRLPGTPAWVSGIAKYRGQPLPVVDLGWSVEGRGHVPTTQSRIVIARTGAGEFVGLLVESVDRIVDLRADHIDPVVARSGAAVGCVTGVAHISDQRVWILDPERTLEGALAPPPL